MTMEVKEAPVFQPARADVVPTNVAADQSTKAAQEVLCGSIAGIIGKYIEYPFDTVKVRLQSQPAGQPPIYAGPIDCFRKSLAHDGLTSLYRGVSAPLFGAALENSSLFLSYKLGQEFLRANFYQGAKELPLSALFVAGAASGAVTSLVLTPVELVKCQMQVPAAAAAKGVRGPGPITIFSRIIKESGIFGLWRGQLGTLVRETGGSVAWFGSYEAVCRCFAKRRAPELQDTPLPIYVQLLAGACGGMGYNISFFPADTIKSCMQTAETGAPGARQKSFWQVGREICRDQGVRGLYRGCGVTVLRSAPSSAFIFTIYEGLKNALA